MKDIQPFDYEPHHQPFDTPVIFKLKPLDLRGQYEVQASFNDNGAPGWDGLVAASRYIKGWSGPIPEYSRHRLREIIEGEADFNWMIWLAQIAGKLYAESLLKEADKKKS